MGEVVQGDSSAEDSLGQAGEVVAGETNERWRDPRKEDTALGFMECPHCFSCRVGLIFISDHAPQGTFDPAGP